MPSLVRSAGREEERGILGALLGGRWGSCPTLPHGELRLCLTSCYSYSNVDHDAGQSIPNSKDLPATNEI
jgi:hypothetical protein